MVCPNTYYLHRRNAGVSYFFKEYSSGKLSYNTYLILEEFLFLFSKEVREFILNFNIFLNNGLGKNNLRNLLCDICEKNPDNFFTENYKQLIGPDIFENYIKKIDSNEPTDIFYSAIYHRIKNDRKKSLEILEENKNYLKKYRLYKLNMYLCSHNYSESFERFKLNKFIILLNKAFKKLIN